MASGLEVALEASRKLIAEGDDSFRFLLVGDGAEREALQERAEAEDLKHVVFTGRLDKSFMPVLLRSVEGCFIHLRKSDLFKTVLPSKLFEAFAVGRPIILGVDGNARELMETAKAGIFIEPGNADALVDAVRQLRYNSTLRDQFSKNGLKYVTQNFNRDELANDYIAVLEGVIKGK
jgi:glycosyltransferase involved in cell wall biosynthesis